MTTYVAADTAIVNRALQVLGTRTTVTTAEMNALSTNESIQINLIYEPYRDQLLRLAPWGCAIKYDNLIWLTSLPGTPENSSPVTYNWQRGQPAPPWSYEYFYPDDCLRAFFLVPNQNLGFSASTPITTAVTGGAPSTWLGQPVRFSVATDQFRAASGLAIVSGGTGYQVGDTIILGTDTLNNNFNANAVPAGIIKVTVSAVSSGVITGATLTAFDGAQVSQNALLFSVPTYTLVQVATSGIGTGAQMTVSGVSQTAFSARVILTNQEYAMLAYCKRITDTAVFDSMFVEAFVKVLGAGVVKALTGDKALANGILGEANEMIKSARVADGNEGLTINDITPDWIRARGYASMDYFSSPWSTYEWGGLWPMFS